MARKSLFGGFSIKCHMYFRAYVKNPQMNLILFSEATGMDKTPTGKSQLAVFVSPQPKSNVFWSVVCWLFLLPRFSPPYSARSPLSWCHLCWCWHAENVLPQAVLVASCFPHLRNSRWKDIPRIILDGKSRGRKPFTDLSKKAKTGKYIR